MSTPSVDLELATLRARDARARLSRTADALKDRLSPTRIFDEAVADVRSGGSALAQTTAVAARKQPRVAAGLAVAGALLILRRPLLRLARRVTGRAR